MTQYSLDQPLAEARVALLRDDEDIGEVGKGRPIGDNAGEADLHALAIKSERHRMGDRATQRVEGDIARPVRTLGEKIMNQSDVEAGGVSVDLMPPAADHATGNNGLGHRDNPCSPGLDDTGAAKTRRADAAPAKRRGC
jgi:hypothetical protein